VAGPPQEDAIFDQSFATKGVSALGSFFYEDGCGRRRGASFSKDADFLFCFCNGASFLM